MPNYERAIMEQEEYIEKIKKIIYPTGYIYRLLCLNTGNVYFGSTYDLVYRLAQHKNKGNRCISKCIIEEDNYTFEAVLTLYNISEYDLLLKEKFYIQNNPCINKKFPLPTLEEMKRNRKEYQKEYREKNKERFNEKINCECGGRYTHGNKSIHLKTKIHTEWLCKEC
jgi:hypothetical protein